MQDGGMFEFVLRKWIQIVKKQGGGQRMKRQKLFRMMMGAILLALLLALAGCSSGSDGAPGATGATGPGGPAGPAGPVTQNPSAYTVYHRTNVSTQGGVAKFHGAAVVTAEDEAQGTELTPPNPKYLAKIAITGATADAAGLATVTFTVKKKDNTTPVTGLTAAAAGIFKLAPKEAGGRNYNRWVPYIYRSGRTVNAGYRENNTTGTPKGTLVENGGGSYTYTFGTNLLTAKYAFPIGGVSLVGYDRSLTHRVSVYLGGHAGPTGEADLDFVPAGGAVTQTRNIVETATCQKCHGANEFRGHGGDRVTVEGCNTCHSPDSKMVNAAADGGTTETIEMAVMIHKMHAGRELASAPGPDGIFFDDPATAVNEAADNGKYTLGSISATWRSAAFPAVLANCVACHTEKKAGTLAQLDNWKTVPSRAACGSCHDLINWTTGANHAGGAATSDDNCAVCHPATGAITTIIKPITSVHNWTAKDIRNIPEYKVTVTTDTPARGYYIKGESPVITIVLKDAVTNVAIDHTTVVEDPHAEGCITNADKSACTNATDGMFRAANMYVTGPRAKPIPVLTTAARAKITSATAGPWDLSAGGAALRVVVDSGNFIVDLNHLGEDVLVPGDFTVTLPAAGAALNALFANPAAATADEVVKWLNGTKAEMTYNARTFLFSDRAAAYLEGGKVSIRTRAVGSDNPSVQIPARVSATSSDKLNDVLFTDNAVKVAGSAAQVRKRTSAANDDPKLVLTAANIKYTLDPVDDLSAGTYMINVEFAERGNNTSAVPESYRTPSIALATFQVKQAAVDQPMADGCTSCHWSTSVVGAGAGFVLDPIRHNKPFNAQAVDQCAGCHNYKSGETVAARTWTTGGGTKPISKRVHAVHRGADLFYPVLTVDHEDTTIGRFWQITYPMNIRNCESCHSAATSGAWKTNPNRVACMGCHDSDQATAHMQLQVLDPTPTAPWSGDEKESCAVCH
jgi:hypothetical protein